MSIASDRPATGSPVFASVALIGIGLIGASLARIIRRNHIAGEIRAAARTEATLEEARSLELADFYTTDACDCAQGVELVILGTPVGALSALARQIAPVLKPGTIVTDVGSTKQSVITAVQPHIPANVHFIPGHPIAGTEYSGPAAGFAELFKNRWCILTPLPGTDREALSRLHSFWRRCGATVEEMDAERHDRVLAVVSHLPQLISYNVVATASNAETIANSEIIKYSASGFRDFTRLAASDPTMWRDVCLNNPTAILETLDRFSDELAALKTAIKQQDGASLFDLFTRTRSVRAGIVAAGQDVAAPNFGRNGHFENDSDKKKPANS